jgi:hypothetical protein
LDRIAHFQNRRDDAPNQELARDLAAAEDGAGIQEIAAGLRHPQAVVRSDCIKTLYEIGYLKPELIASYADEFLHLLHSRENRLVWGAMLALSTIASITANTLYPHVSEIQQAMQAGSVITRDNGVKTLAAIAADRDEYRRALLPGLLDHLATCRPKDVPQHAEAVALAVDAAHMTAFRAVLEKRLEDLSAAQIKRIQRLVK